MLKSQISYRAYYILVRHIPRFVISRIDPLVLERHGGSTDLEPDWLVHLRRRLKELEVSGIGVRSVGWAACFPLGSSRHRGGRH